MPVWVSQACGDGVGRRRGREEASGSGDGETAGDGPHGDEKGDLGQSRGKVRIYTPRPPSFILRIAKTPTVLLLQLILLLVPTVDVAMISILDHFGKIPLFPCSLDTPLEYRVKNASLYGCDDGESMCSVLSFEDLHAKTTQVTDALATVERARESEPVKPSRRPRAAADEGGGGGERIDWREQQRRARAASRSETARFVCGRQGP